MKSLASSADVSAARERLSSDFSSLVSHAEELLSATSSLSSEGVDLARQKLKESIAQVRSQIGPAREYAMGKSREIVGQAVGYARERPWQVAAAIVLAGLFIGMIASSGHRRSAD